MSWTPRIWDTHWVIKHEPYYTEAGGCFQPSMRIDEGRLKQLMAQTAHADMQSACHWACCLRETLINSVRSFDTPRRSGRTENDRPKRNNQHFLRREWLIALK